MKNKIGRFCMILGAVLIISAASLVIYNQYKEQNAKQSAINQISQLTELIKENQEKQENQNSEQEVSSQENSSNTSFEIPEAESFEMEEVVIDGHAYIGYLLIPSINLYFSVMSDWDYPSLDISPCRYAGTVKGEDLVIMAHNYTYFFGSLSKLEEGDEVFFSDVNGAVTVYQVVAKDILSPSAVEEMTAGVFDLTLFTCTYGSKNRVTVYCNRK